MAIDILILMIVFLYCGFVIYRKQKQKKEGGGCAGCSGCCSSCHSCSGADSGERSVR